MGVKDRIAGGTPDSGEVKEKARRASSVAQENPLGLAIGAVAVGFVAGMLIPSTRVEDEKLGSVADDVKDKVKETGQEALEHGKQVAQDAAARPSRRAARSTRSRCGTARRSPPRTSAPTRRRWVSPADRRPGAQRPAGRCAHAVYASSAVRRTAWMIFE